MLTRTSFFVYLIVVLTPYLINNAHAQSATDREAVEQAVLDYVEGFYLVQPERIAQSVSRQLAKVGYVQSEDGYREVPRTYEQLYRGSQRYNADGHVDPETAPKVIEILDLLDQIAVVKLSAAWGIDYLNLAKQDGRWKVINVLWQTYPDDPLTQPYPDSLCSNCKGWNAPQQPFLIHKNSYYVGTRGLSAILITSPDGHILIDGALPDSAPLILDSIRSLGFEPREIKLILNSHAHYDHAGGIAAIQQATGARVAASPKSASVLESGSAGPDDPQYRVHLDFPAVPRVKRFTPGDTLYVGGLGIRSHATAGHTPGGTSWSWQSCDDTRCVDVVYGDSQTPVSAEGFRFTDSEAYPTAISDFKHGHSILEQLPCDILITTHPGASALWDRLTKGPEGLIDTQACKQYATNARARLAKRIQQEAEAAGGQ
ncbi:MAG: subclass B3 metallo-beta-lactamase [Bacteroidota bacterium]